VTKLQPKRSSPGEFFRQHPIFAFEEFLASAPSRPVGTAKALLRYHVKRGNLGKVRRGLYVVGEFSDPWLIASRLTPDAILAYDGALALQRPWRPAPSGLDLERVSFLTATRRARLERSDLIDFNGVRPPRALGANWGRGVDALERNGLTMKITPPARTLVDLLDRIDLSPPAIELWEAFAFTRPNPEAMVRHALALKSGVVAARLGFFLENLPGTPAPLLETLERARPSSPTYFDRARRDGAASFVRRWNLVLPLLLHLAVDRTDFTRKVPQLPALW
jgi:hypothetical protein